MTPENSRKATGRLSNIELLRILAMMAVIVVHLDGASLGLPTPGSIKHLTLPDAWRIIVESLTIVGVNCFTLISGYFGIRASVKGLVRFTLICMFYSVGIYTAVAIIRPETFSIAEWIESWMVFTHTYLWYVPAYFILYLLSPMINAAIGTLTPNRFTLWLALFIIANVWCGWCWGASFNPTGYTPFQLIMMYLIGRWLALKLPHMEHRKRLILGAGGYIFGVTATALLALWMEPVKVYAYNAPWVILSSVALFMFFASLRLRSTAVNTLARGAFAAYLIHKNPAVWGGFIRPTAIHVWNIGSLWIYTAFTLTFTAAIYLVSSAVDSLRARIFRLFNL